MLVELKNFVENHTNNIKFIIYDFFAFTLVYSIPTLSHLTTLPFYVFEPMRVAVLFGILFTTRMNAYILAISLPLFSFILADHPSFTKSILISFELILNTFLISYSFDKKRNIFLSFFLSILLSKIGYYTLKAIFIQIGILKGDFISTNLLLQLFLIFIISTIFYFINNFFIKDRI